MAVQAGKLNKWTFTFSGGTEVVYAPNQEVCNVHLLERGVLIATGPNATTQGHPVTTTKHQSKGTLTGITNP